MTEEETRQAFKQAFEILDRIDKMLTEIELRCEERMRLTTNAS